jgi:hypothetical protein
MDRRLKRWLGVAGLVFVVLVVLSGVVGGNEPNAHASAAKVVAFYHKHKSSVAAQAYLVEAAIFVGLFFFWYLRDLVATVPTNRRLANIGFAGVVIFAVSGGLSAGLNWAAADSVGHVDPTVTQTLNVLQMDFVAFVSGPGSGVFLVATGIALLRSGFLARWLGWVGVILGVISLILPFLGPLPIGLWVLIASIIILVQNRGEVTREEEPAIPPVRTA